MNASDPKVFDILAITSREADRDDPIVMLQKALARIKQPGSSVYVSQCPDPECYLDTTSKEIHLKIGALGYEGQRQLVLFLKQTWKEADREQFIVRFHEDDNPTKPFAILVTAFSILRDSPLRFSIAAVH